MKKIKIVEPHIDPQAVISAAEQTSNPELIFNEALAQLDTDPGAIYEAHVIQALMTIRQNDEARYARITAKATGYKTRLDKLTALSREDRDDSVPTRLIEIAKQNCHFAHDTEGRGVAMIDHGGFRQVWYVDGEGFKDWLRAEYYKKTRQGINANALETAIATMWAIGQHEGDEVVVHHRVAQHDGGYYLDLCDAQWRAIRIDKDGWTMVARPPVLFTRTKNMLPIVEPRRGGSIQKLWEHINIPQNRQLLLLAWMLDCLRPDTPFPIFELTGEQGSAKSSTQHRLRDLIDPNSVALRSRPKNVEDIYVGAASNWMVSFENISQLTSEQQDACCTVSTGGGYASRRLYSNGDEFVLKCKRPIMINGINPAATQPDLIERTIHIEAPTIPTKVRRNEQSLQAAWTSDRPEVLGALLDLFAQALAILPKVELSEMRRMADYQMLGEAIARALKYPAGHFSKLYGETADEGVDRSLETYGIAHGVQMIINGRPDAWAGTVQDLFGELNRMQGADRSNWPKSARGLSGQLRRIAPGLRMRGIDVTFPPKKTKGAQVRIELMWEEKKT